MNYFLYLRSDNQGENELDSNTSIINNTTIDI